MCGVDAGGGEQLGRRARGWQLGHVQVRQAELLDSGLEQRGCDGRAEAALRMMVLGDDQPAARRPRGGASVPVSMGLIE